MKTTEEILLVIQQAIKEINEENDFSIGMGLDTQLIGPESELDSLGLVILIVKVEQAINDAFKIHISIADDRAMSCKHSPFKTIESLAEYVTLLVNEKQ